MAEHESSTTVISMNSWPGVSVTAVVASGNFASFFLRFCIVLPLMDECVARLVIFMGKDKFTPYSTRSSRSVGILRHTT